MTTNSNLAARTDPAASESCRLLRQLIARSRDIVAALDGEFRLLMFNQAYADAFLSHYGVSPQLGDRLTELLAHVPAQRDRLLAAWTRVLRGEEFRSQMQLGEPGRARGTFEINFGALHLGEARVAFHFARDISDRIRDEAEIRRLNAELQARARERELADCMPVKIWAMDERSELIFVNRRWSEYTGLDLAASRALGWVSALHPDDAPEVVARAREAIAAGRPLEIEYRLRCAASGEYRWHLARTAPVRAPDGRPGVHYGSSTDIEEQVRTRRKLELVRADLQRANMELALSLAQLEAIINSMSEGLVLCDGQGRLLAMNPAARRLFQVPREMDIRRYQGALTGAFELRGMDGEHLAEGRWPMPRALRGESFSGYELRACRGEEAWIASFGGGAVYDQSGGLLFALVTARDVTAQHEIESSLREAVEARDRFLSIASHELRTPLTTLVMQLQLARRRTCPERGQAPAPEELAASLDIANRQVRRLTGLVDDLLDISRSASGRLEFHRQSLELVTLVNEVVGQFSAALQAAGCSVRVRAGPTVHGEWDPGRVEQALSNLLSNVIRYAPGAPVTVAVSEDAERAYLSVRDAGPGISPEDQGKIFDRFERCTPDRNLGGLGLGLFLVQQIARGHGGEVELDSVPGRGATFTLVLPKRAVGAST